MALNRNWADVAIPQIEKRIAELEKESGNGEVYEALKSQLQTLRADLAKIKPDATYTHVQSVASAEWIVTHNLGKHPSVTVVDSAGTAVKGDYEYIDNNTCKLTFSAPFGGKAYFN